ncbi:sugar phosphate isomerase/epimerase [Brevundimonas sp. 374]|uniref:sugar phosphate isomerase/epimerase family protein n=1 Tax=Brevundimonas sp. 374 TaxID=1150400 RepID=UPI0008822B06|nr:sugar phosphate isomerase/epimerase [Brevundimonas sp. 374]SDR05905.1 Sugar phosphate isomerase/epimerase [Brevundimonas sp. 374]
MKLALSNLALPSSTSDDDLANLAELGLRGLEVAPTRITPWGSLSPDLLRAFRSRLSAVGLSISSLQAIFYGCEGAELLGDAQAFQAMDLQVRKVAEVAAQLGASTAVFGAPKQRLLGTLSERDAFDLGAERLGILAKTAQNSGGLVLGLEPVPAYYGGDFLPRWQDVLAIVDTVNDPGLRVHLDTGCVLLGGDDIGEAIAVCSRKLAHFQIAEPGLAGFSNPEADHSAAATALGKVHYDRWVSIEMLEQPQGFEAARQAVVFATQRYGTI